ncbi:DAK2 domain-containing protein [Evansella cellulosilytica]|uniref:DAK2 domain fusion protein YloV n=1 Tax=Evansella cellulosilytica (strain ATCC 21833 / DSM 2522 / FERM P-1141 / JCM 9156 / N-4) TaxID=649639 RepID=E6TTN1_EVAC2|nr:DAK2 domain-containing protein [Evansella cellulosilytica]ADU30800.1 DAK2 domain fusion protein YloV [Evansella cellulosilytica DSM 2522]
MTIKRIEGEMFAHMLIEGANNLSNNAKTIDALNVFPVPDGDTGTNMNLTITSGVKEVKGNSTDHVGKVAGAFAKGLLMGARGNSGVILSQLFRGFSKSVEGKEEITAKDLSKALEYGVDMAYKAVMKPVEGTILTVAKDAAKQAVEFAKKSDDAIALMETVVKESKASLKRTPDLLPVLKEVGVVDSGGQGLVTIYEGFLAVLKGEKVVDLIQQAPSMSELVQVEHHQSAQSHLSTEDIEFGYCTEVMVKFEQDKVEENPFTEQGFREELSQYGDSLLVVSDEDLLKIHIHAEYPGNVISAAQKFGALVNVKIENMREQHTSILANEPIGNAPVSKEKDKRTEYAIVTVAMGQGIADLFKGLGAKKVIEGGQTMNPSTEDFVKAIEEANADKIILLPNNSNIIMAAEQAASVSDLDVVVVPSKSVPQGLGALLAFNPVDTLDSNKSVMQDALSGIKTGEVTYAVRDTSLNGVQIKKGDFMGIYEKDIVSTLPDVHEVAKELLNKMVDENSEIVTIIYGEDRSEEDTEKIVAYLEQAFEDVEVEVHKGNQPLYSYIISVE